MLAFTAAAALLVLFHIDNTHFWDDEAYTALFTKNFLEKGSFTGWDGRNLIAFREATLLNSDLESINPPLAYFVCAAGFKLLGYTTAGGRIPFALFGLLAIPITFLLVRRLQPEKPSAAVYSAAALAFSVSYLLYIKQCRYYSLVITLSILTLYLFVRALSSTNRKPLWHLGLALSATALFYAHYMAGVVTMASLGIWFLLFEARKSTKKQLLHLTFAGILFSAATIPYAIAHKIWVRPDFEPIPFSQRPTLFWWQLRELNTCAWLPWVLLLLGAIFAGLSLRTRNRSAFTPILKLATFFLGYLLLVTLLSPQDIRKTSFADTRYLMVLMPVCAIFIGLTLSFIQNAFAKKSIGIGIATILLTLAITTNWLSLTPPGITPNDFTSQPRSLLPAYISEITHPYPEPYRVASDFLRNNIPTDATVLAVSGYTNYPLMFYVGDRILFRSLIFKSQAAVSNPGLDVARITNLDPLLFADNHAPDFIIAFGLTKETEAVINALIKGHGMKNGSPPSTFTYNLSATLDVYAHSMIRPELFWRSFEPIIEFDRRNEGVFVFKKLPLPETTRQ